MKAETMDKENPLHTLGQDHLRHCHDRPGVQMQVSLVQVHPLYHFGCQFSKVPAFIFQSGMKACRIKWLSECSAVCSFQHFGSLQKLRKTKATTKATASVCTCSEQGERKMSP